MQNIDFYKKSQLRFVNLLLGSLLCFQFLYLIPVSAELFSLLDFPGDKSRWFQNLGIFQFTESSFLISVYLFVLAFLSLVFAFNIHSRWIAIFIWLGLLSLRGRNLLHSDFDWDYLGWLLLASVLIPNIHKKKWEMPWQIYWGAWLVLCVSYSASGLSKMISPLWQNGTAIEYMLSSTFTSRFVVPLDSTYLDLPLRIVAWSTLFLEALALPLMFFNYGRMIIWGGMTMVHIGAAILTPLTELSVATLIFHVFVFDSRWQNSLVAKLRVIWK